MEKKEYMAKAFEILAQLSDVKDELSTKLCKLSETDFSDKGFEEKAEQKTVEEELAQVAALSYQVLDKIGKAVGSGKVQDGFFDSSIERMKLAEKYWEGETKKLDTFIETEKDNGTLTDDEKETYVYKYPRSKGPEMALSKAIEIAEKIDKDEKIENQDDPDGGKN